MLQRSKIEVISKETGVIEEIKSFSSISISKSKSAKVSTFSFTSNDFNMNEKLDGINTGDTVRIYTGKQGEEMKHIFTGIIDTTPRKLNGVLKSFTFSGYDLLYGTQQILINESYIGEKITDIVKDLIEKYGEQKNLTVGEITRSDYKATIGLSNRYLYDVLEELGNTIGYYFYCDIYGNIHFLPEKTIKNETPIKEEEFYRGTADFSFENSRLTNHIRLVSNAGLSDDIHEIFDASGGVNEAITQILQHKPRVTNSGRIEAKIYYRIMTQGAGNIIEVENDIPVGIAGLTEGEQAVMVDYNEKTLTFNPYLIDRYIIDDLYEWTYMGHDYVKIELVYRYEFPIVDELKDSESISKYGIFSQVLKNDTISSRVELRQLGKKHLKKYANPLLTGSLSTWKTNYNVNELVNVRIKTPGGYFINEELLITSVDYDIVPNLLTVNLKFEEEKGIEDIVNDILTRIDKLESNNVNVEVVELVEFSNDDLRITSSFSVLISDHIAFFIGNGKIGDKI